MFNRGRKPLKAFAADDRGSFTTTFSLAAPVLLLAISAAVSYSYTVTLQQRTQAAADSAALAATIAMSNSIKNGTGMTTTQAQAVAAQFFTANAPAEAITAQTSAVAPVTTVSNNVVTTTISFQTNPPTLISGVFGASSTLNIVASANSTVTAAKAAAIGNLTGSGWVGEDPIVQAANGTQFMDMCDVTHATWYNLISDSNVEVNANCDGRTNAGSGNQAELYQFNFLLGSHVVSVSPVLESVTTPQYGTLNREIWTGAVTVDGQAITAPSVAGTTTVLSDAASQITAQIVVGQPGVRASAANYVLITTPNYTFSLAFDSDNDGYDFGLADIQISATNAGACSSPGGLWGQTLSGAADTNAQDFAMSSATATAPEFSKTCGLVVGTSTKAKLIQ